MRADFLVEPLAKHDIAACVSGTAQSAADLALPGMVQGRILCSQYARAVICSIDTARARALPGVVAVLTHADCKDAFAAQSIGPGRAAPVLVDKALFAGDWIAAVAAETGIIAEEALGLIDVDYAPLPATVDPLLACLPVAPLVHADVAGNIAVDAAHPQAIGSTKDAFTAAAFVTEFSGVASRPLRADFRQQAAVAAARADGSITVRSCAQGVLGMSPPGRSIEIIAALLARACGRPVKVTEPDVLDLYSQQASVFHSVRLAADSNGTLRALDHVVIADLGAYFPEHPVQAVDVGVPGVLHCSAIGGRVTGVYTNTLPKTDAINRDNLEGGLIFQQAIDRLSQAAGIDPLMFRIGNLLRGANGSRMEACMRGGAERFGWSEKWRGWDRGRANGDRYLHGVGMSILSRSTGTHLFAHQADFAEVEVDTETGCVVLLGHVCAVDVTDFNGLPDPVLLQASVVRGIGMALIGDFSIDPKIGWNRKEGAVALRAATIMDALDPDYVFTGMPLPRGSEGGYEPDILGSANLAPAIANAVHDAAGIRVHALPLSADKILWALRNMDTIARSQARPNAHEKGE